MAGKPTLGADNALIDFYARSESEDIYTGLVSHVDTTKQVMRVSFEATPNGGYENIDIPINNPVTNLGYGLRIIPLSGSSLVTIYDSGLGHYQHLGYELDRLGDITDNASGSKQDKSGSILLRHISEGEVQLSGLFGSEIYFPSDGSILLRNQLGASLNLNNYFSMLEGDFANLKYEMDGVRIRAGNIIRPTVKDTTEDQYIVMMDDGSVKGIDEVTKDDTWSSMKEFSVQVGIYPDPDNNYVDLESENLPLSASPSVGQFTIADSIIREDGTQHLSAGKKLKLYMKVGGGGLNITEDGDVYIVDYDNFSSTKFPTGSERAIRYQKSYFTIQETDDDDADFKTEILLAHESGAELSIRNGSVNLQDQTGRKIEINPYGVGITAPKAAITFNSKDINLLPDGGSVAIGAMPTDGLVKVTHAAMLFDTHTHAGPVGPPIPTFQWQPLINVPGSPLVAQNLKVQ